MKTCILLCRAPFLIDEKVFPPLGLLAVGTALRECGCDVAIRDTPDHSSHHFALGPTTPEYPHALEMLNQIKSTSSKNRVIIGGPHAQANMEQCLADGFDTVVLGDGERVTPAIFKLNGVVNLGHGNLDDYPILNRSFLDIHSYNYTIAGFPATTLLTSRGCPFRCGFCSKTEERVRYRSVRKIEEEAAYLRREWDYGALMFFDDTFILLKERAKQLCEVLRNYGMLWRCFVRGDLVIRHGQDLLKAMVRSGCVEVGIGIESGSDRILQAIHKDENTKTLKNAIGMLRQVGIHVKGFFIVGLPGEDRSSLEETQRFLEEVTLDNADFSIYQPYRGSPIWDNRQDYDIRWESLPPNQQFYKGRSGEYQCVVSTSSLTSGEIVEARDELERVYRCQPSR